MTAKDYLMQVKIINTIMRNLEDEITALREQEHTIRSAWPDGQPHGTGTTDPTGTAATRLADQLTDLEHQHRKWMSALWHKRTEIIETIGNVEHAEHNRLLYLRYVECRTWEEIAVDMHYSFRHIIRMHGDALQALGRYLKKNHVL